MDGNNDLLFELLFVFFCFFFVFLYFYIFLLKDDDGRSGPDKPTDSESEMNGEERICIDEAVISCMVAIPGLDRESIIKVSSMTLLIHLFIH